MYRWGKTYGFVIISKSKVVRTVALRQQLVYFDGKDNLERSLCQMRNN